MKYSRWQAALLIVISMSGNISEFLVHPQLVLAQSNGSQKAEAERLFNSSLTEYNKGNLRGAVDLLYRALPLFKASGDRSGEGSTLNGLGTNFYSMGQYQNAIDYYLQALKIRQELGEKDEEGVILNNLGSVYDSLGQHSKAIELYQQALIIGTKIKNKDVESTARHNLGLTYYNSRNYIRSIQYYQEALKVRRELKDRNGEGVTLNALGQTYYTLKQYSQAIEYFQQSLKIKKEVGNPNQVAASLNNLGAAYLDLGEDTNSINYFKQSLEITRKTGNQNGELSNLNNLGSISYIMNWLPDAENYLEQATNIDDNLRKKLGDEDKISLFNIQVNRYKLLSLIKHRQGKLSESLIASERGRTRVFQDLLAQKQNLKFSTPTFTQLQSIAQKNQLTIVEYSIIPTIHIRDPRPQDELFIYVITPDGKLTVLTQPLSDTTDLNKLVASNRDRMLNDPSNIASRGQNPSANSTLYEKQPVKVNGDPLTAPSRRIIKIDRVNNRVEVTGLVAGETATVPIDSIIPLTQPTNARYDSLRQLHKLLIAPIADLLPTNPNSSVIFIPDGALFEVPFAALQDAEGKYLIDKHTVLTAPSLGVLTQTSQIQPQGKQALVVGDPRMPKSREIDGGKSELAELPFSKTEAEEIAKLYPAKLLIGTEATEQAVKSQLQSPNYRVIHLSTHGILNEKAVGESAIVLAASGKDDGYLTVNEILDLKLNADLVVLSACDTGRGEISGDGVVGLSRALMTAGSRSLIVSLWSVNDRSTSELMQEFYRQWQNGKKSKAVALREAMLKVRQQYPAPYHWAGMTLMGEEK